MPSARCARRSPPCPTAPGASRTCSTTRRCPSLLPLAVEVTVKGDAMALAFDAPDQMRAGINMTYTALLATTYYVVKSVLDPSIPPNAGLARPLTITAPEGSILNCTAPGRGQRPPADLPARRRHDPGRAGAGRARSASWPAPTRPAPSPTSSASGRRRRLDLGLSRDDRRRQRRARHQGRAGRRACPHHQHLEPAGRGAGDRVSADR